MGLDVYVGSLVRYYTGNWETIVQQFARGTYGVEVRRIAPPRSGWFSRLLPGFRRSGAVAATRDIEQWRRRLESQLGTSVTWKEDPDAVYYTDKPASDGYGALLLWAAYEESPESPRPATLGRWSDDPVYRSATTNPGSRYRHLLGETELWLPVELSEPVDTESVTGDAAAVGSSIRLLEELQELNRRTWGADETRIKEWRAEGLYDDALEGSARFGFAVFYELAQHSVRDRLPMKLDY